MSVEERKLDITEQAKHEEQLAMQEAKIKKQFLVLTFNF